MNRWRLGVVALCALAFLVLASPAGAAGLFPGQNTASESYYHLNTEAGTIDAQVHLTVQPARGELDTVWVWLMPGATDVSVRGDEGQSLDFQRVDEDGTTLGLIEVTLSETLKGKLTTELDVTYSVPPQSTIELFRLQPGAIEALFISQGAGSFVLIDVPTAGENVIDSGCVLAAKQPTPVTEAGYERYVCGEAIGAALSADSQKTLERCAKLDDRCRQRLLDFPISAWAQSVTDPDLQGQLLEDVALTGGPVTLELQYFKSDREWAESQFAVAKAALPKLEELFGWSYQQPTLLMRQSYQIEFVGAAGVAFPTVGQVLLASHSGFDTEVTVHELAHQWAGFNLESKWLWEGLAEYAAKVLAPDFGYSPVHAGWQATGYDDPLATWFNGSSVQDSFYWYGKAGDFWFAYESAIGGRENMKAVLAQMDDDPSDLPLTERWFMDRGEEVSGANLDSLFLQWVWVPEYATRELADRRAAHDLVDGLKERAAAQGLVGLPTDIKDALDAWSFKSIEDKVQRADTLIADYTAVLEISDAAGLPRSPAVANAWSTETLSTIDGVIGQQRRVIDTIGSAHNTLEGEPAEAPGWQLLANAKLAYGEGDLVKASQLASDAAASVFNIAAGVQMIAIAEAEQARYSENFLKRIGMLFEDPEGDLAAAKAAAEAGDYSEAVDKARAAFDSWNGAQARGFQRLAVLAAAMSIITFGTWYLLRRVDRNRDGGEATVARARALAEGHSLEPPEHRNWRDWENSN